MSSAAPVSGLELRLLADRAHAAGQKQLSTQLHDLARLVEAGEQHDLVEA